MLLLIVALWKEIMVRREKIPKKTPTCAMLCHRCNAKVEPKAPMSGVIAQIGPDLMVICHECGAELVHLLTIMNDRWG